MIAKPNPPTHIHRLNEGQTHPRSKEGKKLTLAKAIDMVLMLQGRVAFQDEEIMRLKRRLAQLEDIFAGTLTTGAEK